MSAQIPAVEAVASTLSGLGASTAFGLIGSGNFHLVERLTAGHGVVHYSGRHETAVVTMADAWARATGRVGLCTLHQGPGVSNALTGLVEAVRARTPMVVVAGEVATTAVHANQRLSMPSVALTAGAGHIRVERGSCAVRDTVTAWRQAQSEQRPVVLALPVDVQAELCALAPSPAPHVPELPVAGPSAEAIGRAADRLAQARRPIVLAGHGAVRAGAGEALEALAERLGALLATSARAHGLFADHPWSIGICGGFASPDARKLIAAADVVAAFGASLNHWTTGHDELIHPGTIVVQCDSDPAALGLHHVPEVSVLGDARECALALTDAISAGLAPTAGYRGELGGAGASIAGWPITDEPGRPIHPGRLIAELDRRLPRERNVALDGGHFCWSAVAHMAVRGARGFAFTQAFQSVGLGVASAVGLAVARPDRPTVAIVGDGGMMMSLGELDTVASSGLPLLVVVMDDGAYGAEVHHFGPEGFATDLVEFGTRDFASVARAFGIPSQTVATTSELEGPLSHWLAQPDRPFLVDAKIDSSVRAEQADLALRRGG